MEREAETPKAQIIRGLRLIWMRSRERAQCLKNNSYTCQRCTRKKSKKKGQEVKVEVHHKKGITNWDKIVELIRQELLINPTELECLCKECHKEETYDS